MGACPVQQLIIALPLSTAFSVKAVHTYCELVYRPLYTLLSYHIDIVHKSYIVPKSVNLTPHYLILWPAPRLLQSGS